MDEGEGPAIAIVRRVKAISGVAMQPEYHVGPLSNDEVIELGERLESTEYYIEDVVDAIDVRELMELIGGD